jgi:nitroreductase
VDEPGLREALYGQARLPGIPHHWLQQVPVIVALCVDLKLTTHRIAPAISGIPYYLLDAGIAGEHFVLAATEQGLGTCWIGWFKQRAVKRILRIPRRIKVVSLLAVGYPRTVADSATRSSRMPLAQLVRWNGWSGEKSL